jgi:hypothetical protein
VIFNKKYNELLENYSSIRTVNRIFYPRNFALSDEFVVAFKKEFCRLKELGLDEKHIIIKINKALHFHCKDKN